jgi:succinate dehydrogenase hydrophobic anchor subunit
MVGHYILMHYDLGSGHTFNAVLERMRQPFWKTFDLTFITLGLYHGLNGTWNVFRDLKTKPAIRLTLYAIILLAGVAFWVLGVNTILSF